MKSKLTTYLKAGYTCLFALTHEEGRVTLEIIRAAKELRYGVWFWSATKGLRGGNDAAEAIKDTNDPMKAFMEFMKTEPRTNDKGEVSERATVVPNRTVLIMQDFHMLLKTSPFHIVRMLKDAIGVGRRTDRHIIILGCQWTIPPELEKEVTMVEFPLPGHAELKEVAEAICAGRKKKLTEKPDEILAAASGLTTMEFADIAAASFVEKGELDITYIADRKADALKKNGLLEVVDPGISFDDIGGLHELKKWIRKRKKAFTEAARKYGLPLPKGILLFGVQGAGKSWATRAIASELAVPLLRLDPGKLFNALVGNSEANVRGLIALLEAFGPCVLHVDEIDKGFAGMVNSHDGDSGVTRRVIGTFLTWMQEKTSPVFVCATANDLKRLPPEMLRKGRWDELFFLDLPNVDERAEIWAVQIRRHGRKPKGFDLGQLAKGTEGWTGAEIEALFTEGLYSAFENDGEPSTESLLELSTGTAPLSKTMSKPIEELRRWAIGRSRLASTPQ